MDINRDSSSWPRTHTILILPRRQSASSNALLRDGQPGTMGKPNLLGIFRNTTYPAWACFLLRQMRGLTVDWVTLNGPCLSRVHPGALASTRWETSLTRGMLGKVSDCQHSWLTQECLGEGGTLV